MELIFVFNVTLAWAFVVCWLNDFHTTAAAIIIALFNLLALIAATWDA